jgi:hypothetical protein
MIHTTVIPDSNFIRVPIPDNYVGSEMEIILRPVEEKAAEQPAISHDPTFGTWDDMDKSAEDIIEDIKGRKIYPR